MGRVDFCIGNDKYVFIPQFHTGIKLSEFIQEIMDSRNEVLARFVAINQIENKGEISGEAR